MSEVMRARPVWRSLMYVPAHVGRFVEKAHTRGADCILLDIEDAVPPGEKARARGAIAGAAPRVRQGGAEVLVRINAPLALAVEDVRAAVRAKSGVELRWEIKRLGRIDPSGASYDGETDPFAARDA